MSRENVEVVKRAIAAVNERDIDGYLACCTEDIELHGLLPEVTGVYDGPEGIRRFFADIGDTAPNLHLELERVEAIGEDRVIAFIQSRATGRASGIDFASPAITNVYDLVDGKIRRVRVFVDREQALEAVGLRE
jgi:ketosteroid isomerase-like protein